MADIDTRTLARLAFWAPGAARTRSRRVLAGGDAGRERLAMLAQAVDHASYWRYIAIRAALYVVILTVGITIILVLVEFMPAAAAKAGLIDPLVLADNVAFLIAMLVLAAVGALAVTIAAMLIAPHLAAAWSAGSAMRVKLVAQDGDAALLAELEREAARPMLVGLPLIAAIALMLLWLAMSDWLPKTEWLILTFACSRCPCWCCSCGGWRDAN